jgi:hypothetical protein
MRFITDSNPAGGEMLQNFPWFTPCKGRVPSPRSQTLFENERKANYSPAKKTAIPGRNFRDLRIGGKRAMANAMVALATPSSPVHAHGDFSCSGRLAVFRCLGMSWCLY